jgi:hypothetical protein
MNNPKNTADAARMALAMFGSRPAAMDVLTAWVTSRPGDHYVEHIDDSIILAAALSVPELAAALATAAGESPREEYPDNGPTDPWKTSGGRAS